MSAGLAGFLGVLSQLMLFIQGIVVPPILIKTIGTDGYGSYVITYMAMGFLYALSPLGTGALIKRLMPTESNEDNRKKLFSSQLSLQIFTLTFVLLTFSVLVSVLTPTQQKTYLGIDLNIESVMAIAIYQYCFLLYTLSIDYFRLANKMHIYAVGSALYLSISLIFILLISKLIVDKSIALYLIANGLAALTAGLFLIYFIYKDIGINFILPNFSFIKSDLHLGLPILGVAMVDVFAATVDKYIIVTFLGVRHVGYYVPAASIGAILLILVRGINSSLVPLLAPLYDSKEVDEFNKLIKNSIKTVLLFGLPFFIGSIILGDSVLTVYLNIELADKSKFVISIIAASSIFLGIQLIISNIFFIDNRSGFLFLVNVIGVILTSGISSVLLFFYPTITTVAVAILCGQISSFIIVLKASRLSISKIFDWKALCRIILASGLMASSIMIFNYYIPSDFNTLLMLIFDIMLAAVVYFIFLRYLNVIKIKRFKFQYN